MRKIYLIITAGLLCLSLSGFCQTKDYFSDSTKIIIQQQLELLQQQKEKIKKLEEYVLTLMRQENANNKTKAMKQQQELSLLQDKYLEKHKEAIKQQEIAIKQQADALVKWKEFEKIGSEKAKEHKELADTLVAELLKDGLIKKGGNNEIVINRDEMYIDNKKQLASIHDKYMKLITRRIKREFNRTEEWRMRE